MIRVFVLRSCSFGIWFAIEMQVKTRGRCQWSSKNGNTKKMYVWRWWLWCEPKNTERNENKREERRRKSVRWTSQMTSQVKEFSKRKKNIWVSILYEQQNFQDQRSWGTSREDDDEFTPKKHRQDVLLCDIHRTLFALIMSWSWDSLFAIESVKDKKKWRRKCFLQSLRLQKELHAKETSRVILITDFPGVFRTVSCMTWCKIWGEIWCRLWCKLWGEKKRQVNLSFKHLPREPLTLLQVSFQS